MVNMNQQEFLQRYKYDRSRDRIGSGGFGSVYKVFDTLENEYVALKIAEVDPLNESLSLLKEVELASSLARHVNIGKYTHCYRFDTPTGIYDFGILQYYPEGNLSQLIRNHKLTPEEKEHIALGIINGLQHLHTYNIIHRDLKSANILIAKGYGGEYVPKIADFGLSKQFAENDKSYFSNSFAGGSLHYVAPEQLEGKELRKNVDLWSLGVVLYELFVGETPFKASVDDGSETARAEIISKIKHGILPTDISLIPHLWHGIIKSCLIVDPLKRINSIQDVMKSLQGIQDDNTEVEIPMGGGVGEKPFDKKKKILVLVSVLLFGSLAWFFLLYIRTTAVPFADFDIMNPKKQIFKDELYYSVSEYERRINSSISDEEVANRAIVARENPEKYFSDIYKTITGKNIDEAAIKRFNEKGQFKLDINKIPHIVTNQEHEQFETKHIISSAQKAAEEINNSMVWIPGGTFMMGYTDGSNSGSPSLQVTVTGFQINKYEVTQEQWKSIMGTNPCYFKNCNRCPVENMWGDVYDFINKLNLLSGLTYRLPSSEEWEYAARAHSNYKYSGSNDLNSVAWYNSNSGGKKLEVNDFVKFGGKTHEVGLKKPNGFNLYDMTGNVWEMTSSYGANLRGGSWFNVDIFCEVYEGEYEAEDNTIGFRLAR